MVDRRSRDSWRGQLQAAIAIKPNASGVTFFMSGPSIAVFGSFYARSPASRPPCRLGGVLWVPQEEGGRPLVCAKWLTVWMGAALAGAGCGTPSAAPSRAIDGGRTIDGARMPDGGPPGDGGSSDLTVRADGGGAIAACLSDVATRVPPAPLLRLSNFEYANSVRDVLGLSPPSDLFPPAGDVSDDVATLTALTDGYHRVAHDFALAATQNAASLDTFGTCDIGVLGEATCAQRFVAAFVPRLFRRPLDPDDAPAFADVFANGRSLGGDYASGIRAVIEVAMQSPEFLYRVEFGEAVDSSRPALGRPRPYEMATRLSYLLSGSVPDELLEAAAAQDRLKTKAQIEEQARRLLGGPHAHDVTRDFYTRFWRTGDVATRPAIGNGAAAGEETTLFVDDVVWREGGDLAALLTAPFSFVNASLAQTYQIPGAIGTALERTDLPSQQRRGVLTQVSLLASAAATDLKLTRPSERGALVFEQLLCGDLSQKPPAEQHVAPARTAGETTRQWLQRVTAASGCRSCHRADRSDRAGLRALRPRGGWRNDDRAGDRRAGHRDRHRYGGKLRRRDGAHRASRAKPRRRPMSRPKWMESAYGRALWPRTPVRAAGRTGVRRHRRQHPRAHHRAHSDRSFSLQAGAMNRSCNHSRSPADRS